MKTRLHVILCVLVYLCHDVIGQSSTTSATPALTTQGVNVASSTLATSPPPLSSATSSTTSFTPSSATPPASSSITSATASSATSSTPSLATSPTPSSATSTSASSVTSFTSAATPTNTPMSTAATSDGSQGSDCSQASDCAEGFVCRSNTCDCPVGYSYYAVTRTCHDGCLVYGTGFSYQERWCIYGYNNRKYMGLDSAEACADLCLKATSFECVSFEMDADNCYLQEVSQLDVPTSTFVTLGNCDSYQRHCAVI